MERALELAERGRGSVSPNPLVGAVLVRGGRIVGEGFHQKFGEAHAEVNALEQAGDEAESSTLYVTLEPCCHQGKTGPCTHRLLDAGVVRVVAGMQDPHALVNGKGFKWLRSKGIEVRVGVCEEECYELNAGYIKWVTSDRPLITMKTAQTLDGRIATSSGHAKWITSAESRTEAHRLRAWHDAVLVGINTVIVDDPQLNVRHIKGVSPLRLVLDSQLRVPLDAKLLSDAQAPRTIIVTTGAASKEKVARIQEKGASVWVLAEDERGWVDQATMWKALAEHGVTSVLLEGGNTVFTECLKSQVADRVAIFIAPKIVGSGIDAIGDLNIRNINSAITLEKAMIRSFDGDWMVTGNLRYHS